MKAYGGGGVSPPVLNLFCTWTLGKVPLNRGCVDLRPGLEVLGRRRTIEL